MCPGVLGADKDVSPTVSGLCSALENHFWQMCWSYLWALSFECCLPQLLVLSFFGGLWRLLLKLTWLPMSRNSMPRFWRGGSLICDHSFSSLKEREGPHELWVILGKNEKLLKEIQGQFSNPVGVDVFWGDDYFWRALILDLVKFGFSTEDLHLICVPHQPHPVSSKISIPVGNSLTFINWKLMKSVS